MENNDNKKQNESSSDTANIRQTNKQQEDDRGEINMGGRQFSGDEMDMETGSSGVPTVNPDEVNHPNENLKRTRKVD